MTFFAIPECLKTDRFQNTRFHHILEPLMISLSGMAHIFAFQNHKHVLLKEHTSFLKHKKLGVLESLFFSHSGKAKKDGFQNQKRSANDIFKPFRNTKKWPFQNPKQQPHSGRP